MVVICLFFCLGHLSCFFLFSFKSLHDIFSLLIFIDHNIAYTEISNNNSRQTKHIISIFRDNGLIIPDSLIIPLKHKENMSNIKFPRLMICTKLSTSPKQLFNNRIILLIPINLGLRHKYRNILF